MEDHIYMPPKLYIIETLTTLTFICIFMYDFKDTIKNLDFDRISPLRKCQITPSSRRPVHIKSTNASKTKIVQQLVKIDNVSNNCIQLGIMERDQAFYVNKPCCANNVNKLG